MSKSTDSPRIVDAVFGPHTKRHRWLHVMLPIACALAAHLIFVLIARSPSTSLEEWSEEVGRYVHEHVVVVTRVQYAPPPPEPAPPTTAPPAAPAAHAPRPSTAPAAPAQAAPLVGASPDTVDLSGTVFVEGSASSYAGGATTSTGTGTHEAAPNAQSGGTGDQAPNDTPSRASGVALLNDDWNCPWPEEADDAEIDEQLTVVRVVVRADGSAESARALSGAEHGFGRAAVACAMAHRFAPARNAEGLAIRAESASVRVTFTRRGP